jgi:hypothetical protein
MYIGEVPYINELLPKSCWDFPAPVLVQDIDIFQDYKKIPGIHITPQYFILGWAKLNHKLYVSPLQRRGDIKGSLLRPSQNLFGLFLITTVAISSKTFTGMISTMCSCTYCQHFPVQYFYPSYGPFIIIFPSLSILLSYH